MCPFEMRLSESKCNVSHLYWLRSSLLVYPLTFREPSKFFVMPSKKTHKVYQRLLDNSSIGYALYTPVESSKIYPGCVGFFDATGHWHKMGDVFSMPPCPLLCRFQGVFLLRRIFLQLLAFSPPIAFKCLDSTSGLL